MTQAWDFINASILWGTGTVNKFLLTDVRYIGWSVRTMNALTNNDITTIAELVTRTESELLRMPNFGRKSLQEILDTLEQHGFHLK
jgi:DNA-directed RNA polymerase subunit alpha